MISKESIDLHTNGQLYKESLFICTEFEITEREPLQTVYEIVVLQFI
jgi:hypothetical protein